MSIDGGKITASGHVNVDDRVNTTTGISYDYTLNFKEGVFHEGDTFKIGIKELGEDTRLPKELKADDGTTFAIRDSYKSLYNNLIRIKYHSSLNVTQVQSTKTLLAFTK